LGNLTSGRVRSRRHARGMPTTRRCRCPPKLLPVARHPGNGALHKEPHTCPRSGRAMRRAKAYSKASHVGAAKLKNMVMISERPPRWPTERCPATGRETSSSARR
jgi:hypothetical protein